jgi:hypothetical protein
MTAVIATPSGAAAPRIVDIETATRPRRFAAVMVGCFVLLFGVTYLQRFGYVIDELTQIPASIGTTALALGIFYVSGLFTVSATRLMLFALASAAIILSLFVSLPLSFSIFSLLYLFILYTPYVFTCELDEEEYKAVLRLFQNLLLPLVVITFAQFATTMAGKTWFDPMDLLPQKMVLTGFNTHPPMGYGSPIIRPNGEFFLEPSFVSQWMALGVLIEVMFFRRWMRIALYAGAIVASLSGTGFMMLAFFLIWMAVAYRQWSLLAVGLVAAVGLFMLGDFVPVIGDLLSRATEFREEQSSSFMRFVGPIVAIGDSLGDSLQNWLGGLGPGAAKQLDFGSYVMNPFVVSKLMIEEGLIGCIPFVAFATYCFFSRPFRAPLAGALYLMYMVLSGSLQQPHTVYLFLALSVFFVPRRQEGDAPGAALPSGVHPMAPYPAKPYAARPA